jgi:hypothetical protein
VALAVQEGVGGRLVVVDRHARERLQDPGQQDLEVGIVAGVVPGHDVPQPVVVLGVGGLPGLALAQRRVLVGHGGQPPQDEAELDRHRLLAPQGAVVVEDRNPLLGLQELRRPLGGDPGHELPDRRHRRAVVPRSQELVAGGCHRDLRIPDGSGPPSPCPSAG